jgi:hypothetical protein
VIIHLKQLKDVEIIEHRDTEDKTIRIVEMDGSFNGALTEIKIPAASYCFLEEAIVDKWLESEKQL